MYAANLLSLKTFIQMQKAQPIIMNLRTVSIIQGTISALESAFRIDLTVIHKVFFIVEENLSKEGLNVYQKHIEPDNQ